MKKLIKEIWWHAGLAMLALMIIPTKHTSEINRSQSFYPARIVLSNLEKIEYGIQLQTGLDEKEKSEVEIITETLDRTRLSYLVAATSYRPNDERSLPK